mgnify:CR=1 FL=1
MEEKKTTTVVRINNADYRISSPADEEYVRHVSYYVDKKIKELAERDRRLSTSMASVLAAINIADEYMQAQQDNEKLRAQILKYADCNFVTLIKTIFKYGIVPSNCKETDSGRPCSYRAWHVGRSLNA